MTVDLIVNLLLVFFVGNTLAILVAGNLNYILAHFFALTGFLLLRKDRPPNALAGKKGLRTGAAAA
jgi:amino acid transporter